MTHVRSVEERAEATRITFPRVLSYRLEIADERLHADFTDTSDLVLSSRDLPTTTTVSGVLGAPGEHGLETLERLRENEVVFRLARAVLDRHLRDAAGNAPPWYFPQLVPIVREWMRDHVDYRDRTYPGLLLLGRHTEDALGRIAGGMAHLVGNRARTLLPVLTPYDTTGSTDGVSFDTTKGTYVTDPDRCHVTHVVEDSTWESAVAQVLETLPEVAAYVKNDRVGFAIPYTTDGEQRRYVPDFLVRARVPDGEEPLTVIVEVSGAARRDKKIKLDTARNWWIPAVEAHGGFGRWRLVEVTDPWDCRTDLVAALSPVPAVPA